MSKRRITNLCPDPQAKKLTSLFWPTTVYNVMDYGAHADGAAFDAWFAAHPTEGASNPYDDQPHIQAAIHACSIAGGGIVYVPAGDYRVWTGTHFWNVNGGCLILEQNVTLMGDGPALTTINGARPAYTVITARPYVADNRGVNIGVRGMTVGWSGLAASTANSIKFFESRGVLIDNVVVQDQYIGMNLTDCENAIVTNSVGISCSFTAFEFSGIVLPDVPVGTGTDNNVYRSCEASACGVGFRIAGLPPVSGADERIGNCGIESCYGHGNNYNFYSSYCHDIWMSDCEAANGAIDNVLLRGVHTAVIDRTTYSGSGGSAANINYNPDYGTNTGIVIDGVVMD